MLIEVDDNVTDKQNKKMQAAEKIACRWWRIGNRQNLAETWMQIADWAAGAQSLATAYGDTRVAEFFTDVCDAAYDRAREARND